MELKNCPLCNGEAMLLDAEMSRTADAKVVISWDVICKECSVTIGYKYGRTRKNAAEMWNKIVEIILKGSNENGKEND